MADALQSLGEAIKALVTESMASGQPVSGESKSTSNAEGTTTTSTGTGQQSTTQNAPTAPVTQPSTGTTDMTQVSQTNQGAVEKTTNMKTGEYVSPYQAEQQQLLGELQQAQLPTEQGNSKAYIDEMFKQTTAPFEYDIEKDPLVAKAKENLQQSIMDMANKRGFAYGSYATDIVRQQMEKLQPQFEEIAYNRNSDYLNRQIALANTMMKWEQVQFDRKKNAIELLRTKLDFINKLDQREFNIFKVMLDQRNMQRQIHMEELKLSYTKQNNDVTNALNRIESLGYVDNQASLILGMPVGTKAKWAQQAALQHQNKLEQMAKENEYALQKQALDASMEKELFALQNRLDEASKMKYQTLEYNYKKELQQMEFNYEQQKYAIAASAAKGSGGGGGGGGRSGGGSSKDRSGSGYTDAQLNSKFTTEAKRFMAKFGNKKKYGQDAAKYLDMLYRAGVAPEVLMRIKEEFKVPNLKGTNQNKQMLSFDWTTGTLKIGGKVVKPKAPKKKKTTKKKTSKKKKK